MRFLFKISLFLGFYSLISVIHGAVHKKTFNAHPSGTFLCGLCSNNNVSSVFLTLERLEKIQSLTFEQRLLIINYQMPEHGDTPLLSAVKNKSAALVKALLDAGANMCIPDKEGKYAIHRAVENRDGDILQILLLKNPFSIDLQTQDEQRTVLHYAALEEILSLVTFLLRSGARYNIKDYAGAEPLLYAAMRGNKNITRLLLNHGASPCVQDNDGKNVLHVAIEVDQHEYLHWFVTHYEYKDLLVAQEKLYGDTPLHTAIKLKKPLSICVLLALQPPLDILNDHHQTVFDIARDSGDASLIELLESCDILFKRSTDSNCVKKSRRL